MSLASANGSSAPIRPATSSGERTGPVMRTAVPASGLVSPPADAAASAASAAACASAASASAASMASSAAASAASASARASLSPLSAVSSSEPQAAATSDRVNNATSSFSKVLFIGSPPGNDAVAPRTRGCKRLHPLTTLYDGMAFGQLWAGVTVRLRTASVTLPGPMLEPLSLHELSCMWHCV